MTPIEWYAQLPVLSQLLLVYLAIMTVVTFFAFGIDKLAATLGHRRTPEKILWILTALGGSLGALAGMEFFKHKRRKVSFYTVVVIILLLQLSLTILLLR